MTGLQPGIGGQATGDARGACADVSGTPYVGADQFGAACPATAAQPDEPDFPQPLSTQGGPGFGSQLRNAAPGPNGQGGPVTGSSYEQGRVTGPFGMAGDRVTGTEEFRFGPRERSGVAPRVRSAAQAAQNPETVDRTSRITGEGMDLGARITGDDWDRGDRVTGTEGTPATGRNPTRRGGALNAPAAQPRSAKRNDDVPAPTSRVTGGSGGDTEGAAVTYSGGARG